MFLGEPAVPFSYFSPLLPLTDVSPQPRAIPGGNPPGDWQSAISWGDSGFEPGTAGQQSGALPLSHYASPGKCTRRMKKSYKEEQLLDFRFAAASLFQYIEDETYHADIETLSRTAYLSPLFWTMSKTSSKNTHSEHIGIKA
jgi:hypothetical protein